VLPSTRHKWTRPAWYSTYLPRRDVRLSWPSWLDSAPAGSRTSDLSITSLMPNHCTTPRQPRWQLLGDEASAASVPVSDDREVCREWPSELSATLQTTSSAHASTNSADPCLLLITRNSYHEILYTSRCVLVPSTVVTSWHRCVRVHRTVVPTDDGGSLPPCWDCSWQPHVNLL